MTNIRSPDSLISRPLRLRSSIAWWISTTIVAVVIIETGSAQSSRSAREEYATLALAINRLHTDRGANVDDLEGRLGALRSSRGGFCAEDESCAKLWQAVTERSRANGLESLVSVKSSRGNGALVKYQTILERMTKGDVHTMKNLTTVNKEAMTLGAYYMWTERSGHATSDLSRQVDIAGASESVELAER